MQKARQTRGGVQGYIARHHFHAPRHPAQHEQSSIDQAFSSILKHPQALPKHYPGVPEGSQWRYCRAVLGSKLDVQSAKSDKHGGMSPPWSKLQHPAVFMHQLGVLRKLLLNNQHHSCQTLPMYFESLTTCELLPFSLSLPSSSSLSRFLPLLPCFTRALRVASPSP